MDCINTLNTTFTAEIIANDTKQSIATILIVLDEIGINCRYVHNLYINMILIIRIKRWRTAPIALRMDWYEVGMLVCRLYGNQSGH